MHAKFGREVRHWPRPQHASMARSPRAILILILPQTAIGVVDPAMQSKLIGARLKLFQRIFVQQRNGTVIKLAPAQRIKIAKYPDRMVIPAPPHISSQSPKLFLSRSDKTIEQPRLAHNRRNRLCRLGQQTNFIFRKDSRRRRLNHQNALQYTAVNERNSKKRLEFILARLAEVFKARMVSYLLHRHWTNFFRDQARESFTHRHAQLAHAFMTQTARRRTHQV